MCVRAQTPTNDAAAAAEPSWWSGIWAAGRVNADNDAPINVGQLKHVASRALAWLNTISISQTTQPAAHAARESFRGMVAGWTPGPAAENAAPVPVGALKETAAKFHDVLAALGYPLVTGVTVGDVLEAEEGLTNPPRYPWGAAGTLEELQAPANVGQLKTAFRAPHPGLVEGTVELHPELTLADDGQMADGVSSARAIAAVTVPVWGSPRMGAVAYAADGSTAGPNLPTAVRLARPTLLRFSPWLSAVKFQGVVHFTAVEHRIADVTTWIPVVSGGVLAENVSLPYSPGLSADFKGGTYVEFAQVATRRDRPDANQSAAITIRSAYPLVRRGTLAADSLLQYSATGDRACTFAGGSEVRFHQFPRLIERARWNETLTIERFEAVGMVAQGTLSATMAAQPVQASPGVTLTLAPGRVADFAGFLTRHLVVSGSPPPAGAPSDLMTSGSGTDLPEHEGSLPENSGPDPYATLTESAGARVFFRVLPEPRPGDMRPVDGARNYLAASTSYWYRESEQAVGWLARGIPAADVDLPAGVLGVGKVKCSAQHPVTFRHFLHEVTAPPPGSSSTIQKAPPPHALGSTGTTVGAHTIDEYIHGYLASAVTSGLATVSMPAKRVPTGEEPAEEEPELEMNLVPPLHTVAFEHDAMLLAPPAAQPAPWWLPVVRGLLIAGSVSPVASNPQAADADGDGFTAGEESRMGSSDGDAAVPGGVRPFLASTLAGLGPHVIHDERDAARPVGNGAWGHQTVVSIPVTAEATKRYLSLVVTHRGFPRGTRSAAVSDTLTWSLTGAGASLGGTVKASDLHHAWLNSMAGGRTLGGARPFWVIPLGFVADGEATAGVTVTTASARGEWVVAAVLTEDSQALAGVGGRFVAAGAGVPENYVRINDRPAAIPFARRPQISGDSTPSGSAAGFDSDGDFSPNLEEQAVGTDPQDKHSAPVVLSSLILTRETKRYRPNPNGWSGYTELNVNDGWAVFAPPSASPVGHAQLGRTYQTSLIPGTQFNTWDFSEAEYQGDPSGLANDFVSLWEKLGKPTVPRGLPADNGGSDGLDAAWSLYVPEPERRVSATTAPFRGEYIATTGMRYRLRGPLSDEDQARTFLKVRWEKTWSSYEAYMSDVSAFGCGWWRMAGPNTAALGDPVSVEAKTLIIPKGAQYSKKEEDLVPKLPAGDPPGGQFSDGKPRVVVERLLPMEMVPDWNRDGKIDTADSAGVTSSEPYRFWVNDDRDSDDLSDEDEDADLAVTENPDSSDERLDSYRDLIDWFPVFLDIKAVLEVLPPATHDYLISQEDEAVNFIPCSFLRANTSDLATRTGAYLTHPTAVFTLVNKSQDDGPPPSRPPGNGFAVVDWPNRVTIAGVKLSPEWLAGILPDKNRAVMLIEGRKVTNLSLKLNIVRKTDGKKVTVELPLSMSSVKDMYRWVNLRAVAGEAITDPDNINEPVNWPDRLSSDKSFIFVHGYSVGQKQARGWAAETFKRMFFAGSKAKFYAMTWRGNQGQISPAIPFFGGTTSDYWVNVYNAFLTSPALAAKVNAISGGGKYLAGHSLGNMVASSAMVDHGMGVNRYFMINAAVPGEAYASSARLSEQESRMIQPDWRAPSGIPSDAFAGNYGELFLGTEDYRRALTWRGRFAGIQNVFQLYSSGEDVLEPNRNGAEPSLIGDVLFKGTKAWVGGEMKKGTITKAFGQATSGDLNEWGSGWKSRRGGWSFNRSAWPAPNLPTTTAQKIATPLFKPFNEGEGGESVHGAQGSALLANSRTAGTPGYRYLAALLAQDIPALSWPAGSVRVAAFGTQSMDLQDLTANGWDPERRTFEEMDSAPPNRNPEDHCWHHSDIKNVSYFFNYPVFEKMVNIGNLKN